jgi:hypothetical protein
MHVVKIFVFLGKNAKKRGKNAILVKGVNPNSPLAAHQLTMHQYRSNQKWGLYSLTKNINMMFFSSNIIFLFSQYF